MIAQGQADTSFKEQVAKVVSQEGELLRQGRAIRIEITEVRKHLASLEVRERDNDLALVKTQHFLDGVGLGQRYQAENIAAQQAIESLAKTTEA